MSKTELTLESSSKCFDGHQLVYSHQSRSCNSKMRFSIYVPDCCSNQATLRPLLYFLPGRDSTEETFSIKSQFQCYASKYRIVVICTDTLPRLGDIEQPLPSFYLDATDPKWSHHYQMYTYVTVELPEVIKANFSFCDLNNVSIFGHSMGGHGALMCAFKNPIYKSVSAFAPVTSLMIFSERRRTLLTTLLGPDEESWKEFDVIELMKRYDGQEQHILIDQGTNDQYLNIALCPDLFVKNIPRRNVDVELRIQAGYDHGYNFVRTFVSDHFDFHAKHLRAN